MLEAGKHGWICPLRVNDALTLELCIGFAHKVGRQWKNTQAGSQLLASVYEQADLCAAGAEEVCGQRATGCLITELIFKKSLMKHFIKLPRNGGLSPS